MKALAAILCAFVVWTLRAQAPPAFEVASIHPSSPDASHVQLKFSGDRFSAEDCTLHFIVQQAYGLRDFQVTGGPDWAADGSGARFDIQAKAGAPASGEQLKLMAQALLADRFRLQTHRETRPVRVYALVAGKNGPKLHSPKPGGRRSIESYPGYIEAVNAPMAMFTDELSGKADRPVIDKTGLSDRFDFSLRWTPDTPGPDGPGLGSLFTAIQEQLGLRLEPRDIPFEVLVIDRAERPSAN